MNLHTIHLSASTVRNLKIILHSRSVGSYQYNFIPVKIRFNISVEQINITGVGSGYPQAPIFGIKTVVVEEFKATGLGGLYLSGLEHAVVVSMGTGTAYLDATKNNVRHIIGSGVGGGTLVGLGMALTGTSDAVKLSDMATSGDILSVSKTRKAQLW